MCWNLRFPATAPVIPIGLLRLKKEVNRKENTVGKIAKRRLIATDSKVYACSDVDLGEVLFHYALFCYQENRDLSSNIYRFSLGGILRFAGPS